MREGWKGAFGVESVSQGWGGVLRTGKHLPCRNEDSGSLLRTRELSGIDKHKDRCGRDVCNPRAG